MKSLFLKIKCFFNAENFYKNIRNKFTYKSDPMCRLEKIDLAKKIIIIHCRGLISPIKLSLDEAIYDSMILSNLTSKQASWIGYYYGKYYKNSINDKKNYNNFSAFSIDEGSNIFKIKMINRQGNIIYSYGDKLYTIQPIRALNDESTIKNFNPIQACYIGILAGTSTKKAIDSRVNLSNKGNLEIVK